MTWKSDIKIVHMRRNFLGEERQENGLPLLWPQDYRLD